MGPKHKKHCMLTRKDTTRKRRIKTPPQSDSDTETESKYSNEMDSHDYSNKDYVDEDQDNTIRAIEIDRNSALYTYTNTDLFYYCGLPRAQRDKILQAEKDIAQSADPGGIPLRFKILMGNASPALKAIAIDKLNSCHDTKSLNWVKAMSKLPLGIIHPLEVTSSSSKEDVSKFLQKTKAILDKEVYGHAEAKRYILFTLAKWITNPDACGIVIGIEGDPGSGKSLLVKEGLSKALNIPCAFLPLGGANASSYLDGHHYTYEGSMYGKVAEVLMQAKCMNPIFCFDELDKVADNSHGQEVFNVLIHLTDATQNMAFQDQYFSGIDLDVSRSIIVFTYNDESKIHHVLKDRMIKIRTSSYTPKDKIVILRKHMIPKLAKSYGFDSIEIDDSAAERVVSASVSMRDAQRILDTTISSINFDLIMAGNDRAENSKINISRKMLILPPASKDAGFLPMYL